MSNKILIIRFSSIGDIVLTTPLIRCLKKQLKDIEIHYLTKNQNSSIIENNIYLSKIITFNKDFEKTLKILKSEKYDFIVDLQNSMRSKRFIFNLNVKHKSFNKVNLKKWLLVNLKINLLPKVHVVDRYFDTLTKFKIKNDKEGADFFISKDISLTQNIDFYLLNHKPIAIAVGSKHNTKQLPIEKVKELLNLIDYKFILLGGKDDIEKSQKITEGFEHKIYNACGELSLQQSAKVLKNCKAIITGDTGLMHIAAALKIKIFSLWGNTVIDFGMKPYLPKNKELYNIYEVNLKCRPCSKLGFKKCPKQHFNCMMKQDINYIANDINKFLKSINI